MAPNNTEQFNNNVKYFLENVLSLPLRWGGLQEPTMGLISSHTHSNRQWNKNKEGHVHTKEVCLPCVDNLHIDPAKEKD